MAFVVDPLRKVTPSDFDDDKHLGWGLSANDGETAKRLLWSVGFGRNSGIEISRVPLDRQKKPFLGRNVFKQEFVRFLIQGGRRCRKIFW